MVTVWQEAEADKCDGCGHPRSETFDPENEGTYRARLLVCHACAARELRAKASDNPPPGAYYTVE